MMLLIAYVEYATRCFTIIYCRRFNYINVTLLERVFLMKRINEGGRCTKTRVMFLRLLITVNHVGGNALVSETRHRMSHRTDHNCIFGLSQPPTVIPPTVISIRSTILHNKAKYWSLMQRIVIHVQYYPIVEWFNITKCWERHHVHSSTVISQIPQKVFSLLLISLMFDSRTTHHQYLMSFIIGYNCKKLKLK